MNQSDLYEMLLKFDEAASPRCTLRDSIQSKMTDFTLPPIDSTSGRSKRAQRLPIAYQEHTQHWESYARSLAISEPNEHRVVHHLKHKLHSKRKIKGDLQDASFSAPPRIEGDPNAELSGPAGDPSHHLSFHQQYSAMSHRRDIFSRYSDVGDLPADGVAAGPRSSLRSAPRPFESPSSGPDTDLSSFAPSSSQPSTHPDLSSDGFLNHQAAARLQQLSSISETAQVLQPEGLGWGEKDASKRKRSEEGPVEIPVVVQEEEEEEAKAEDEEEESEEEGEKISAEELAKRKKAEEDGEGETFDDTGPEVTLPEDTRFGPASFRHIGDVSPVATPGPSRPKTREGLAARMAQGAVEERLEGQPEGPPPETSLKIFVTSAITDSEMERTALLERVFPHLRQMCLESGFDLVIQDLHWGSRDLICNDHSEEAFCLDSLAASLKQSVRHINFVAIIGDKYGSVQLPAVIAEDEFHALWEELQTDQQKLMHLLEEKRLKEEEEERKREEEEARRREAGEDVDGPTKKPPSFRTVAMTQQENGDDELPSELTRRLTKGVAPPMGRSGPKKFSLLARTLGRSVMLTKTKTDSTIEGLQEHDPALLQQWYRLDTNLQPPVYRLQTIGTHIKDFLRNDVSKRQQAKNLWINTAQRLQHTLQTYAKRVFRENPATLQKFNASVYAQVLDRALLKDPNFGEKNAPATQLLLVRTFPNLRDNLADNRASDYIDLIPMKPEIDLEKFHALTTLKMKLNQKLIKKNHLRYEVPWSSEGISPVKDRSHVTYLNSVCADVEDRLADSLQAAMADLEREECAEAAELQHHVAVCSRKSRALIGRRELLAEVKKYLRSDCRFPLVLYGRSGVGKTTLMSRCVMQSSRWLRNCGHEAVTVSRCLGTSGASSNVRLLLRGLCRELAEVLGEEPEDVPQNYESLTNDFAFRLGRIPKDVTLLVFLDGVDELSDDHNGRSCAWVPKDLPPNVRLVISTAVEDRYEAFAALKKSFGEKVFAQTFLEVPLLPPEATSALLNQWLQRDRRQLNEGQLATLTKAIESCPLPLYIELAYRESLAWSSEVLEVKLMPSLAQLAAVFMAGLEKDYGEPLVRRALGYLTAAHSGLTDNEMEDLLSLDDVVMDDLTNQLSLRLRRCPPSAWLRLRRALGPVLRWKPADGVVLLSWSHKVFFEAANERYLNQRDKAPSYHKILAEYFDNEWSEGRRKPHGSNDRGSDRFVLAQPLVFESTGRPNLRRLNELPVHYLRSQQFNLLKRRCLCNFDWLFAKLSALSLADVQDDVTAAMRAEAEDQDARTLSCTLRLAAAELQAEPKALATQLLGRLTSLVRSDKPAAPKDPEIYPALHPLYFQARRNDKMPTLVPSLTCMTGPEAAVYDTLGGHQEPLTALAMSTEGTRFASASQDDTTKLWDLRTLRVVAVIDRLGREVLSLTFAKDDCCLVSGEKTEIRVWDLKSLTCLLSLPHESADPALVCTADVGQRYLVAFFDGVAVMRVWNLKTLLPVCKKALPCAGGLHQDRTVVATPCSPGDQVLYGIRGTNRARVLSVRSGKTVFEIAMKDAGSIITAVNATAEYCLVACRCLPIVSKDAIELFFVEVFEAASGTPVRRIKGCANDRVDSLLVNSNGTHAVTISCHPEKQTADFAVWNLETEEHKHVGRHAKLTSLGAMRELRVLLTASRHEPQLCLWNLQKLMQQGAGPASGANEPPAPVSAMYVLPSNDKYVVTLCGSNVVVWNVVRNKCRGAVVRREKAIISDKDTLLFNDQELLILSDNRYSPVVPEARSVYQSAVSFNLMKRQFGPKLKDIFILPAPPEEMVILSDSRLLGLSENRGHFVVWSLQSGQVVKRLRTNFRDAKAFKKSLETTEESGGGSGGDSFRFGALGPRGTPPRTPMTTWDRRNETHTARKRRGEFDAWRERQRLENLRREHDNVVDRYILSADHSRLVAAYYAHHMCVFKLGTEFAHTATLSHPDSLMHLYVAAVNHSGSLLVHTNYDEALQASCVTLWDTNQGVMRKRIRNERAVCALAISDSGHRVVLGKRGGELRLWNPFEQRSLRRLPPCPGLKLEPGRPAQIRLIRNAKQAVIFAGGISIWDLEQGRLLSILNSDLHIQSCDVAFKEQMVVFTIKDSPQLYTLRLMSKKSAPIARAGEDWFGEEKHESTETEDDAEEEAVPEES